MAVQSIVFGSQAPPPARTAVAATLEEVQTDSTGEAVAEMLVPASVMQTAGSIIQATFLLRTEGADNMRICASLGTERLTSSNGVLMPKNSYLECVLSMLMRPDGQFECSIVVNGWNESDNVFFAAYDWYRTSEARPDRATVLSMAYIDGGGRLINRASYYEA